jgi:hypothetical protein
VQQLLLLLLAGPPCLTDVMNLKAIITFALLRVTMRMYRSAWRRYMKVQLPSVRTGVCVLADSPLLFKICVLKLSAMSRLHQTRQCCVMYYVM